MAVDAVPDEDLEVQAGDGDVAASQDSVAAVGCVVHLRVRPHDSGHTSGAQAVAGLRKTKSSVSGRASPDKAHAPCVEPGRCYVVG